MPPVMSPPSTTDASVLNGVSHHADGSLPSIRATANSRFFWDLASSASEGCRPWAPTDANATGFGLAWVVAAGAVAAEAGAPGGGAVCAPTSGANVARASAINQVFIFPPTAHCSAIVPSSSGQPSHISGVLPNAILADWLTRCARGLVGAKPWRFVVPLRRMMAVSQNEEYWTLAETRCRGWRSTLPPRQALDGAPTLSRTMEPPPTGMHRPMEAMSPGIRQLWLVFAPKSTKEGERRRRRAPSSVASQVAAVLAIALRSCSIQLQWPQGIPRT